MRLAPVSAVAALLAVSSLTSSAFAKDFYVDPAKGAKTGDGSAEKPWKTLEEVFADKLVESQQWESYPYAEGKKLVAKNAGAPVKAGDTIYLLDGYHGAPTIAGYYNDKVITIAAAPNAKPRFGKFALTSGKNFKLVGLSISPSFLPAWSAGTMLAVEAGGGQGPISDVVVESCFLEALPDASAWTKEDWDTKSPNGISVRGARVTVRKNHLHNVNFGIVLGAEATDGLVDGNLVDTFSGDGMRGLGDREVFQGNVVKNALQVNDNHSDGFQSWSVGADKKVGTGEVKGIVLRGNLFLNKEKLDLPFAAGMQGIGCFDGTYVDFVIENNVVISDTYHGIALYGSRNARIVNNTVLRRDTTQKPVPWIGIFDHKNGTKPDNALVRNNLTAVLSLTPTGVTEDHNAKIKDADWAALFVDPAKLDFHLKPGSTVAIDAGVADQAPATDFDGIPRPQGKAIDLGAFEQHDGSVMPVGGTGGTGGTGGSGTGGTTQAGGSSAAGSGGTASAGTGGTTQAGGSSAAGSGGAGTAGSGTAGTSATGGTSASGGSSAQGGSTSSAGAAGQPAGKGGSSTGVGASAGASSANAGSSGAGGTAEAAGANDDSGCGCRVGAESSSAGSWRLGGGLLVALGALVRRRPRRSPRSA